MSIKYIVRVLFSITYCEEISFFIRELSVKNGESLGIVK